MVRTMAANNAALIGRVTKTEASIWLAVKASRRLISIIGPRTRPRTTGAMGTRKRNHT